MTAAEGKSILDNQEEMFTMLKSMVKEQRRFQEEVNGNFAQLRRIIVGNGENERAVLPRMTSVEKEVGNLNRRLDKLELMVQANTEFKNAWRNRVIGMGLLIPLTTVISIALVAYIFARVLAP